MKYLNIIILSLALIVVLCAAWRAAVTFVPFRAVGSLFCHGLRSQFCTANSGLPDLRTANAAEVRALLSAAKAPAYNPDEPLRHQLVTTANSSLFVEAHYSEPLTTYALGWTDPAGYDRLSEFIAPPVTGIVGQLFEHIEYPNAEAFLSDDATDDLRPIGADFKTVDYTSSKARREIPNRGLRMVLDWDKIKTMKNWQQHFTGMLIQRLARNAARRKVALALATGTAVSLVWDAAGAADPDLDLANQAKLCGDSSGISPNRALWGMQAKLLRYACYGATNTAKATAGRLLSPEQASQKVGLEALVDESRFQSGTATKTPIVGSKVLLFSAYGQSGDDPSNFKTARGNTDQGGRFAIYVRQISVKFWEIVAECYEAEWAATVLGARTATVSQS